MSIFGRAKELALKVLAVLILVGFFAGWITVVAASHELYLLKVVQAWPARRGIITRSYVRAPRSSRNRKPWGVEIAGLYLGTEQKFFVSHVGYGFEYSVWTRGKAERLAAQYPVKLELEVFHEPGNPAKAILVRGNSPQPTWIVLGVGLGFGLLPLGLYGYGRWRDARKGKSQAD
jgi:hypothetical protein